MRHSREDPAAASPGVSLFAYGTLLLPEVMAAVTGGRREGVPAVLPGYARYRLRDATYPGIVKEEGACTAGILYRDVGAASMALLDRFENGFYRRSTVWVRDRGESRHPAETYVIPARRRDLLSNDPWDEASFRRDHLAAFLASIPSRWKLGVDRPIPRR